MTEPGDAGAGAGSDLYDAVADLPVVVEGVDLHRRERATSSGFTRVTTVVELHGDGATGRGEDVTYDAADHDALHDAHGAGDWTLPTGEYTLDGYSRALDGRDLFPAPPEREDARDYRRWAVESAVLDLALRRADTDLASELGPGYGYDPVRFVASTRLGDPPTTDRVERLLDVHPDLGLKLDPTPEWSEAVVDSLARTGAVRVLDLKAGYSGTVVDNPPDRALYRRLFEAFPDAVVEDPGVTEETRELVAGVADRVAWDQPIHGVEDVRSQPVEPQWLNVKPSRFGSVRSLFGTVEHCRERDIRLYGGGQFELDVGRGQIQLLASLLYPDAPNDVAPRAYNDPEVRGDLPGSPLAPSADPAGFRWERAD